MARAAKPINTDGKRLAEGQQAYGQGLPLDDLRAAQDPWYAFGWTYSALMESGTLLKYWRDHWAAGGHLAVAIEGTREVVKKLEDSGVPIV